MLKCTQSLVTKTITVLKEILKRALHWTITSNYHLLNIILATHYPTYCSELNCWML